MAGLCRMDERVEPGKVWIYVQEVAQGECRSYMLDRFKMRVPFIAPDCSRIIRRT